jgi:hypothetical protein
MRALVLTTFKCKGAQFQIAAKPALNMATGSASELEYHFLGAISISRMNPRICHSMTKWPRSRKC